MSERDRLSHAAHFYLSDQLEIDKRLIRFRYHVDRQFFVGTSVLELGPADGVMTNLLLESFDRVTVVDGSPSLLEAIPEHPRLTKVCALFEDFAPRTQFDTILLEHVLEHVDRPVTLLKSAKNWLVKGGVLIAGVPNARSIHRLAAVKMGLLEHPAALNERDVSQGHRRVYTVDGLVADFEAAGLQVAETGGLFLKPLSHKQIEEQWTDSMISAFFELGREIPEFAADIYAVARV